MTKLILASSSSYRKAILAKLGIPFTTESPDIDEQPKKNESVEHLVLRLAEEKAAEIAKRHQQGIVIGSDQLAVLDDQTLGKPYSHENATKQLLSCSGKKVSFLTGLCIINCKTGRLTSSVEQFHVHFRQLNNQQIENYLKIDKPYDCAGSFKSEGLGISLFSKLQGDDPNILIGLPLIKLIEMLEQEGIRVI